MTTFNTDSDWMFASPLKIGRQPYSYTGVWRELQRAAQAAGIGMLGTHSFRHTYRSWLEAVGTPIAVQQKLMRHSDIRTTMNIYGCGHRSGVSCPYCGTALVYHLTAATIQLAEARLPKVWQRICDRRYRKADSIEETATESVETLTADCGYPHMHFRVILLGEGSLEFCPC